MVNHRSKLESLAIYLLLIVGSVVMFYPFLFQVLASFGSNIDYYNTVIIPIPTELHLDRYLSLIHNPLIYHYLINTLIRCVYYIVVTCFVALIASYVFTKLRFKGRDTVFIIFLTSMMVPGQVTLIPTYLLFARFPFMGGNDWMGQGGHGMIDTWGALLLGSGIVNVAAIFLVKQTMESIPFEYEEAARIDGAGVFRTIFGIYLPMTRAVLAVIVITTFIAIWNDYLWPLVAINSPGIQVINTGVTNLLSTMMSSGQVPMYPDFFALTAIVMLPPIVVYLLLQRNFIQGYAMAGVKG
ncbi:multiple sugar transport system permease protein [Paenibacillus taihuensis]|uniref:Multiple sugar transport system permease protein n=1 Tax=Paenibacillus taihuensis TaxID=1156355 RepID=A0A3D9RRR6_9BACL|nr:carbohydrate ABC transporter permease [Paenibacillus taihuensis]REE82639.1 multiple sugar transport system permease protein [Paenibacillus taihuensis]